MTGKPLGDADVCGCQAAGEVNAGGGEKSQPLKKHPCPDCSFCQWCGDDRCALCLRQGRGKGEKLSLAEQIALYDRLNRTEPGDDPS